MKTHTMQNLRVLQHGNGEAWLEPLTGSEVSRAVREAFGYMGWHPGLAVLRFMFNGTEVIIKPDSQVQDVLDEWARDIESRNPR